MVGQKKAIGRGSRSPLYYVDEMAFPRRHGLRFKWVGRYDEIQRHFRLFRIIWQRGHVGDGQGYSVKLSVGIWPRLFHREGGRLTLFGLRVHYARSYGGIFA